MQSLIYILLFLFLFMKHTAPACVPKTSMLIGAYVPQCDENGLYKTPQCWGSVGKCWEVNVTTNEPL